MIVFALVSLIPAGRGVVGAACTVVVGGIFVAGVIWTIVAANRAAREAR